MRAAYTFDFKHLRGDIYGGLTAGVVAIPLAFVAISADMTLQEGIQNLSETLAIDMSAMAGAGDLIVIGVVLVCIYPVLSLIFLNKEKSKAALK